MYHMMKPDIQVCRYTDTKYETVLYMLPVKCILDVHG